MNASAAKPSLPVCSQCGQPDAYPWDEPLCESCAHQRGSCGATPDAPDEKPAARRPRSEITPPPAPH